jgi:putative endonuclease
MTHADVYILRCADGSFYTGLTRRDPDERVSEHQQGLDPNCYTFSRRPVTLVFSEFFERVDEAAATERRIKGWSRAKKQALIARNYPELSRLASRAQGKHDDP